MNPQPYVKVNSSAERERLIRAIWPLNVRVWMDRQLDQTLADLAKYYPVATYPYLWVTKGDGTWFYMGIDRLKPSGSGFTPTNSVNHMVAYMRARRPVTPIVQPNAPS